MDLMQNYCLIIRAHLIGLGPIFLSKKCSLGNVNNSVQISSPLLLLSKRYSRFKVEVAIDYLWWDTHVGILGYPP